MSLEKRDRISVKKFEQPSELELVNLEDLNTEERAAFSAAFEAYKKGTHEKIHAGAAAVAEDGKLVATANDIPGSFGHAEQRAISELYQITPPGHKRLKILALAVSLAGDEINGHSEIYTENTALSEIKWSKPCGKCLEFISDCTANVDDVEFLGIINSKQAMRTSIRTLMPHPYISNQVPYNPEKQRPEYRTTTGSVSASEEQKTEEEKQN